jgi:hypothetical protein
MRASWNNRAYLINNNKKRPAFLGKFMTLSTGIKRKVKLEPQYLKVYTVLKDRQTHYFQATGNYALLGLKPSERNQHIRSGSVNREEIVAECDFGECSPTAYILSNVEVQCLIDCETKRTLF